MKRQLPSFLVVGVQKAGTTTLHNWLSQQPDVCLPRIKETHFFSDEGRFALGVDWYVKQFPNCGKEAIVGEVDPDYAFYERAPLRIRQMIGSPRFIFIFRHPVDRAYSHYRMSVRRGYEPLSFRAAVLAESDRLSGSGRIFSLKHHSYLARGRYSEQVVRYRDVFDSADFLYINFDDLVSPRTRCEIYARVCEFIGVRSSFHLADLDMVSNPASMSRSILVRDLIYKQSPVKKLVGRLLRSKSLKRHIAMALDRWNRKPVNKAEENNDRAELPQSVTDELAEEIARLEMVTGLDLQEWLRRLP